MKSIIQSDKSRCYLCGRRGGADPLDEHHVFGGPNRKISEKDGLKVFLCHSRCHIFGNDAVHKNCDVDKALKASVQALAMDYYGWTTDDFRARFGKNYF